jgi:DnaJ-class molecular chaperone
MCNGTGKIQIKCSECDGKGWVSNNGYYRGSLGSENCLACNGTGVTGEEDCPKCGGKGYICD